MCENCKQLLRLKTQHSLPTALDFVALVLIEMYTKGIKVHISIMKDILQLTSNTF